MAEQEPKPLLDRVIDGVRGRKPRLSERQVELAAGITAALEWIIECLKADESDADPDPS